MFDLVQQILYHQLIQQYGNTKTGKAIRVGLVAKDIAIILTSAIKIKQDIYENKEQINNWIKTINNFIHN